MTREQARALTAFIRKAHLFLCYRQIADMEIALYDQVFEHIGASAAKCSRNKCPISSEFHPGFRLNWINKEWKTAFRLPGKVFP